MPTTSSGRGPLCVTFRFDAAGNVEDVQTAHISFRDRGTQVSGVGAHQFGDTSQAMGLPDGRVIVMGGASSPRSTEIYYPTEDIFWSGPDMDAALNFSNSILSGSGTIVHKFRAEPLGVAPGDWDVLAINEDASRVFDPDTDTFGTTAPMNTQNRIDFSTDAYEPNGWVAVTGGCYGCANDFEIYSAGSWFSLAELQTERIAHTTTFLDSTLVLVTGGFANGGAPTTPLNSAELCNWLAGTCTALGTSMNQARAYHTDLKLADGRVLLIGGRLDSSGFGSPMSSGEIYDPSDDSFTPIANMPSGGTYSGHAVLLDDGRVLLERGLRSATLRHLRPLHQSVGHDTLRRHHPGHRGCLVWLMGGCWSWAEGSTLALRKWSIHPPLRCGSSA